MNIRPLYEFEEHLQQEIIKLHLAMPRGGSVSGPVEGTYGSIYSLTLPHTPPGIRIAAKCPRIKRFGTREQGRVGIEQILYEIEKAHSVHSVPWVNRFFDIQIVQGWPFILSRYRDGNLEDLIANPLVWTLSDRLICLILVARALRLAGQRGLTAHQDLKPGNIFFDDLSLKGLPKESRGMHFHVFVSDFGLADAFREFGRNQGSRPYMAPEQFSGVSLDPNTIPKFDVFALAVIACECLLDGQHPLGVVTRDVWPWQKGIPQKWNRESTWRNWAETENKTLPASPKSFPSGIYDFLLGSLAANSLSRPSIQAFEEILWRALDEVDPRTADGFRMQVAHVEGLSSGDSSWPHMDERLSQLREFYSSI